ncbi:LOB domain-containing protein 2 [Linum grandiflorum]
MPRGLDIIPHANGGGVEGPAAGLGAVNGAHSACASCKHQRKKCAEDCILAPVFPAEKTREFQAVHKVFGVSNVVKMMRRVEARDRERVAESLVWEANSRENDPVLGAMRQYQRLQEEKKQLEIELGAIYKTSNSNSPLIRQGHGGGGGGVYTAPLQPAAVWSNNNSSNSNNSTVVTSTSNGKGCHSNSNGTNNNLCNNQNGMGMLQSSGMISNPTSKVKKVEDGFIGRHPMPNIQHQHHHHLLQNQHQLLHQFAHPAGAHHQFYPLDNLPGQFPAYSYNGQVMENNL